jgi:threonylcarbamoyladenosine tRNA methylthiotransferase MtaB
MVKLALKTLGCKANRYESDRLLDELGAAFCIVENDESADFVVVNTCTVTHVADRKSRQAVSNLRNSHPRAKVVVFGCGARTARDQYEEMGIVDYVARDRNDLREFILREKPQTLTHDGQFFSHQSVDSERTRSLIKVQDGCDRFCSYCIIPFTRGLPRSFYLSQILAEIHEKEKKGYQEIVLTGINIGDWNEQGKDFGDLLEEILDKTNIARIRISSIEPCDFSEKFYEIMAHPRICKHLHLCLQAGSDAVLEKMCRNYRTDDFRKIVAKLRSVVSEIGITTDVITAFPGETEAEFQQGVAFIKEIGFSKLHVFPYSRRRNTPAAKFENQVEYQIKMARVKFLINLSNELEKKFKENFLGSRMSVLFEEKDKKGRNQGYTSNYIRVFSDCDENFSNQIKTVYLKEINGRGEMMVEDL